MKEYNGHRSWNAWNVSLWINNDEFTYNFALSCIERAKAKLGFRSNIDRLVIDRATRSFHSSFKGDKTPDGANYNRLSIKEAIAGLMD